MTPRPHNYDYYPPYWDGYHGVGMTLRQAIMDHHWDGEVGRIWEGQEAIPEEVMGGTVERTVRTSVGTCYLLVRSRSGTVHISYGPADTSVPTRESQGRLCLGFLTDD